MARKITDEDLANRGVMGLPDVPGLTAIEMQKKLEEIPREVIIPRYNELVDSVADICDEFSKLITYDVGDYCIYENVLYKCTTAITTEGEWDATKWKPTNCGKELVALNSNLSTKTFLYETTVSANALWQVSLGNLSNITNGEITPDTFCGVTAYYGGYSFDTYLAENGNLYVEFRTETTISNVPMRFVIFGKK